MVDEDCGDMKYCLYEIENSKCLPCIPTDMVGILLIMSFVVATCPLKAALIDIFISTMDHITLCNVKCFACIDKPTRNVA